MQLDTKYQNLLNDILANGRQKGDRTGTGTISVFGREIRHNMSEGFPLLTTKKMYLKGIIHELIWFLKGETNIKYLVDNNVNIWNGDAYKKYTQSFSLSSNGVSYKDNDPSNGPWDMENFVRLIKEDKWFASMHGDLGPVYGKQWRNFDGVDQMGDLVRKLKTNPDDRRMMVTAWNPPQVPFATLPPCHYGFTCNTHELTVEERIDIGMCNPNIDHGQELGQFDWDVNNVDTVELVHGVCDNYGIPRRQLNLKWNQRSVDTFLGLPFNIASYGVLLLILAKESNMVPGELIGSLEDTHIYNNHVDQCREQMDREPLPLPTLNINYNTNDWMDLKYDQFTLEGYQSHASIKGQLSN